MLKTQACSKARAAAGGGRVGGHSKTFGPAATSLRRLCAPPVPRVGGVAQRCPPVRLPKSARCLRWVRWCDRRWREAPLAIWVVVLLLLEAPAGWAVSVTLVQEGQPAAVLVLPDSAAADERLAALELQHHLERMSGARLAINTGSGPDGLLPVRIGAALSPAAAGNLARRHGDQAAFALVVTAEGAAGGAQVMLAGNSPEGTLLAAYELLERLGCRWYLPGELGTVIPRRTTVTLAAGETVQAPSFAARHLQSISGSRNPWSRRVRLGGPYFPGSHGIPLLPKADFEQEPELFALVDGQRTDSQLCVGNPEVVRRAAAAALAYFDRNPEAPWVGMGPNDGGGFCECARCRALDTGAVDPVTGRRILTDRYMWLFQQVLKRVHATYPDKKIAFYAYTELKQPPGKLPISPSLVPALAPIRLDRIHGMSNPMSPDRSMYRQLMTGWRAAVPEVYERGYYFNLACPGLPFSKIHAVRDETPVAHELGVKGWRVESMPSWASNGLTLYVAARLMWDVNTDVDALLQDFYSRFFGPAAEPMGRYLEAVDIWFRDTECITGSSYCMPVVFTPERMEQCTAWLDAAAHRAGADSTLAERVRIFRLNHERLAAFLGMLEARDRFDFAAAKDRLQRLRSMTQDMVTYRLYPASADDSAASPPGTAVSELAESSSFEAFLVYPRTASYIDRFWAQPVQAGFARTVTHGELAAAAPEVWDFLIDPTDAGEVLGYYRDGPIGGNWQPLHTSSASWSDQGLHYYKGLAWYRTALDVEARFAERPIYLWFGAVDEAAEVWLNGDYVGRSDVGAFRPFDLEVTGKVRFDEPNYLVVRITNWQLNELGTGGIVAPVMLWSPRSAADLQAVVGDEAGQ